MCLQPRPATRPADAHVWGWIDVASEFLVPGHALIASIGGATAAQATALAYTGFASTAGLTLGGIARPGRRAG